MESCASLSESDRGNHAIESLVVGFLTSLRTHLSTPAPRTQHSPDTHESNTYADTHSWSLPANVPTLSMRMAGAMEQWNFLMSPCPPPIPLNHALHSSRSRTDRRHACLSCAPLIRCEHTSAVSGGGGGGDDDDDSRRRQRQQRSVWGSGCVCCFIEWTTLYEIIAQYLSRPNQWLYISYA